LSKNSYYFRKRRKGSDNRRRSIGSECRRSLSDKKMKNEKSKTDCVKNFASNKKRIKKKVRIQLIKVARSHLTIPNSMMHRLITNQQSFHKHLYQSNRRNYWQAFLKS